MSRVEFTALEWRHRPTALRKVLPAHAVRGCDLTRCGVFKCRAPGGRFACGRYVGACMGGDDNRCADCANKAWRDLKDRIVAFVKVAKTSRGEIAICMRFGRHFEHAPTVDALHELVKEKRLFWFGDNEKPLRYVTYGRRFWAHSQEQRAKRRAEVSERAFLRAAGGYR